MANISGKHQMLVVSALVGGLSLYAVYRHRRRLMKIAKVIWDGDPDGEEMEMKFRVAEACVAKWSSSKGLSKMSKKLKTVADEIVEASKARSEAEFDAETKRIASEIGNGKNKDQPSLAEETAASSAAASSSYYHFDSKGNKFKSKWDSFDVDAELKKLDDPADDKRENVAKRRAGLEQDLGVAHIELWTALETLDSIVIEPGDEASRGRRKALVAKLQGLMDKKDEIVNVFETLPEYPQRG